ncbi:protein-disulfide reductase DsbD [Ferrimonas lipolytica]|uniref:Thiol:disulfide interchange protein DsbD n=1 Tax=Ferrimonas lipolytica TaxID=2724191 RepID=A0A6H1UHR0_9GAMM|nr:protein-disulfide reductase DsbD [Ferrimonas lipolytica]QIZ78621.1 protein-disulfide reductase DsbD [Ferrimonas lipolytica]
MKRVFTYLLLAFTSFSAVASFDFIKDEPQVLPVDQAYLFDFDQQGNKLMMNFTMAGDDYYLYQEKFKLKVTSNTAEYGEIVYPEPTIHTDDFFGDLPVYFNSANLVLPILEAGKDAELTITYQGCLDKVLCYPPTKIKIPLTAVAANDGNFAAAAASFDDIAPKTNAPQTEQDGLAAMLAGGNLWVVLATLFGLGILLAFTPCVFPMYPILTGIIAGHGSKLSSGKAFALSMTYVQGMALTYTALGLVVASAGAKYQAVLQSPSVLIGLAILFVVLSLSMFGVYELQLPSGMQNKLNTASNKQKGGSFIGVFIMGLISGLVASPCTTAPLSGVLIYVAQSGDLIVGGSALYALSLGMGLPLILIGTSGGKLLPRAGAWMETIKHVFGFLLLSVSLMMLSRIWSGVYLDLAWMTLGVAMFGYLLWKNSKTNHSIAKGARFVLLCMALLGSISYGLSSVMADPEEQHHQLAFVPIKSIDDLNTEIAKANAQGKAVMLDLYADWCVSCKEFEHLTFPDPKVRQRTDTMVMLQADLTEMDEIDQVIMERYDVLGLPTLLFFGTDSEEISTLRVTGFMNATKFSEHLDKVLAN